MPRNPDTARRNLQLAALELFCERGYDGTTASEIAARAGVTERTFFRHFQDKREVLFSGESPLTADLVSAVANASPELGPWDTLIQAFSSLESVLVENRNFAEPRRRIIASTPVLQERELAKIGTMTAALEMALRARGVDTSLASLAAQMGMATLRYAITGWENDGFRAWKKHLATAFHETRVLASSLTVEDVGPAPMHSATRTR